MTKEHSLFKIVQILRNETGAELVEFSLSIMVLLTLLFGIMDICRAAYSYSFTTYAAQEGARFAIVRGYHWHGSGPCNTSAPPNFTMPYGCEASQSDVQNYVKSIALPLVYTNSLTVTPTWPGTTPDCSSKCTACTNKDSQGCYVSVTVSYNFNFFMPFLPSSSALTLAGTSVKSIQE